MEDNSTYRSKPFDLDIAIDNALSYIVKTVYQGLEKNKGGLNEIEEIFKYVDENIIKNLEKSRNIPSGPLTSYRLDILINALRALKNRDIGALLTSLNKYYIISILQPIIEFVQSDERKNIIDKFLDDFFGYISEELGILKKYAENLSKDIIQGITQNTEEKIKYQLNELEWIVKEYLERNKQNSSNNSLALN